jgi:hypothetical protein
VKVVSERLGHASATITWDIYQHVTPSMASDAAQVVADLIFGPSTVTNGRCDSREHRVTAVTR